MARRGWVPAALAIVVAALAAAYFAPLGDWVADNPLPGQEWMRRHTGLALVVFALVTLLAGSLAWQRRTGTTTDSATGQAFDARTDGYLNDLRQRMKVVWIDEFLSRSLERIVPAKLGFQERRDAITGPLRILGTPDLTGIVEIYSDERTARRLVVLGEPGAGKTTQLLRLAEHLLDNADGPVPIVVSLSGSSWKIEAHKPAGGHLIRLLRWSTEHESAGDVATRLAQLNETGKAQVELAVKAAVEWLAWEIGRLYQVPPKQVALWLLANPSPVVLLLDGLDEIRDAEDRRRCVEVLSLLRSRLNTGMVVCSRTAEYFTAGRLAFGVAVEITPLRAADVDDYLHEAGQELASLREACRRNPELVQLLDTPLTLTVAVLTYRGKPVNDELAQELVANRLDHLWSAYLNEALPRLRGPTSTTRFSHEQTMHYAQRLASLMESAGRDNFTLDMLNLSRLRRDTSKTMFWVYLAMTSCGVAAVIGSTWLTSGSVVGGISAGVLLLLFSLARWGLAHTELDGETGFDQAEFVSVRWRLDWKAARESALVAGIAALVIGLIIGAVGSWTGWLTGFWGLPLLLLALLPCVTVGLSTGVLELPFRAVPRTAPYGRQVSASGRTLRIRLGTGAVALLPLAATLLVISAVAEPLRPALTAVTVAITMGMWIGGFVESMTGWVSHRAALRLAVREGLLPPDLAAFLAHTEERIITRRRLDGHAFLHRTLQSHLAGHSSDARTARHAR